MCGSELETGMRCRKRWIAGWLFVAWALSVCFTFSGFFLEPFDEWKGFIFYLGCGIVSAIMMIRDREDLRMPEGRLKLACIAFFILSLVSLAVARGPICEGINVISKSILLFSFIWAMSRLPDSFIDRSFIAIVVLVSAMIVMILLKIDFPPLIAIDGYIIHPVGNVSYFSDLILACMFMALFQIWRSKKTLKIIWAVSAIILGVGLWLTGTRASMIGFVAGAAAMAFCMIRYGILSPRRLLAWSLLSAAVIVLIIAINPSANLRKASTEDRLESLLKWNLSECSLFLRRVAFFKTEDLVRQRPFFGYGPGSFKFIYPEFAYKGEVHDESKAGQWYIHPHNELLFQLFENGTLATVVLVSIIALICLGSIRMLSASRDMREKMYTSCVLSALLAMIVSVQFSPSMQFATTRLMFAMFAGVLLRHAMPPSGKYIEARFTRVVFVSIICCATLFVAAYHAGLYAAHRSWCSDDRRDRLNWAKAADAFAPGAFYPLYAYAAMSSIYESPSEAERVSGRLYRNYPFVPNVLYVRGFVLMRVGRLGEAGETIRHAIANDPSFEDAKELLRRLGPSSKL